MTNEFSVYQWFVNNSYEEVLRFVEAESALITATRLTQSVGGRMGTTKRVIITDGGDFIVWEWLHGEGVVFPPSAAEDDNMKTE